MSSYVASMATYVRWAWDLMTHVSFFQFQQRVGVGVGVVAGKHDHTHERKMMSSSTSMEGVECAVCLSVIEEDEEIRVLRCDHVFHKGCLDRCVEYRHTTCPLCRDFLAGPRMVCELGREILFFNFCSNNTSTSPDDHDDFDRWWIR